MKDFEYLKNVTTLELDPNKCNGCNLCINVCPHEVFALVNKKAKIVRLDHCMECGACANNCEQGAITLLSGLGCGCATGIINGYFSSNKDSCSCSSC